MSTDKLKKIMLTKIKQNTIDEGSCMIWQGQLSQGKYPQMRFYSSNGPVRLKIFTVLFGAPKKGYQIGVSCGVFRCVNPAHLISRSKSAASKGVSCTLVSIAKIRLAMQKKSLVMDWDKVREIRASSESGLALDRKYNLSRGHASRIRNYKIWVEATNPFTGLGAR